MKVRIRTALVFAALGAAVSGCSGLSQALGVTKTPPDEFAITTKAPLVVPPDFSLRPPKPGETRPQEMSPSERARSILLGDASAAPPSQGEQLLVRKTGALGADPNIRAILAAENGGRSSKGASLANALIFWKVDNDQVDYGEAPLRVDNEQAWLAARTESVNDVTGGEKVVIRKDRALGLPGVF